MDFYPRSPCGERRITTTIICTAWRFLSTLSLRRATSQQPRGTTRTTYFYPRSPCGERHRRPIFYCRAEWISIHALLAESDQTAYFLLSGGMEFLSTLSLRRATMHALKLANPVLFLSTLSLRRATVNGGAQLSCFGNFYPRSPCGERRGYEQYYIHAPGISIHALLAESDCITTITIYTA